MNPFRWALVALSAASLGACAYPVATVEQGNVSTSLYFPDAPVGAHVMIDGADAGEAILFDGRKTVLTVTPGKHHVVIPGGAAPLYDQSVYVGAGSRLAIKVH
jgi:hypothetical protein